MTNLYIALLRIILALLVIAGIGFGLTFTDYRLIGMLIAGMAGLGAVVTFGFGVCIAVWYFVIGVLLGGNRAGPTPVHPVIQRVVIVDDPQRAD